MEGKWIRGVKKGYKNLEGRGKDGYKGKYKDKKLKRGGKDGYKN